jgi:hypothetical protein
VPRVLGDVGLLAVAAVAGSEDEPVVVAGDDQGIT